MGDSEEKIEYTPEEQAEIDRVIEKIPVTPVPRQKGLAQMSAGEPAEPGPAEDEMEYGSEPAGEEYYEEVPEAAEDVVDVTDLIQEVEEPSLEGEAAPRRRPPLEEEEAFPIEVSEIAEGPEFEERPPRREAAEELPAGEEIPDRREARSTLDELDEIVESGETAIERPEFEEAFPPEGKELSDEFPVETASPEDLQAAGGDVSFKSDAGADLPDLSDIDLSEPTELQEADLGELPAVDLEDISAAGFEEPAAASKKAGGEAGRPVSPIEDMDASFGDIGDISSMDLEESQEPEPPKKTERRRPAMEEPDTDILSGLGDMERVDEVVKTEKMPVFEEEEEEAPRRGRREPEQEAGEEGVELSDRELKKLKTAILMYNPALRREIRDTILNDRLSAKDTRQLIDLIITGKPEDNVHRFLEKKLGKTIDLSAGEEAAGGGRRVISTRSEYTKAGIERQKRLLKVTRIFGIAAAVTFVLTITLYQFVYKPLMARSKIRDGVALIRRPGIPALEKRRDFENAEKIFREVDEDYVKDYIPGYNAYARAYFDVKEYEFSYLKLKKAFEIAPANVETLNNLGYLYSRIPEDYYERHYEDLWPPDKEKKGRAEQRLDIAIRFYRYSLTRDPKNVTAMYGIGNTYMYQGRFFEARQYYENILKVDRSSVVGYSGLLNLFIERDNFVEVVTTHTTIKEKRMLSDLDSALLAKLAWYYLGKKRSDRVNIRIDYGAQSQSLRDISDNPYPVVRSVLNVLAEKDGDYPPLYVHKAKLAQAEGNYRLMKEFVKMAISKEPNYFAAQHLLGEYHYLVNEPVEAYRSFKNAIKAYENPPAFTLNDFYQETESIGRSYAMIGNVFYYYFDKVRARYKYADDIEESAVDDEMERKANNSIAQEYYEKAVELGDNTPETLYNLGRLYYLKGLYEKALEKWLVLYDDFISKPELMFALGNAFYRMNNYESSKGEYLRLISVFEEEAQRIPHATEEKTDHIKIMQTLSSAYNNLGAIYQMQGNTVKSNLCYWRSIEYATRINRENEFARVNLGRSIRTDRQEIVPLLDEELPFGLDVYRRQQQ